MFEVARLAINVMKLNPDHAMNFYYDKKLLQSQAFPQQFPLTIEWLWLRLNSLQERLILSRFFFSRRIPLHNPG